MKDLIIITDKSITYDSCAQIIKNNFKNLILRDDRDLVILMKKKDRGFEFWITPNDVLDDPQFFMGDTVDKCPNKKANINLLCYTHKSIAKKIVELLKPLYGRMWIQSDEEDDWFGTADEFIEIYCKEN